MHIKIQIAFTLFALLLKSNAGFAQNDTTVKVVDSLQNNVLLLQSKQLQELEKSRVLDSLKKMELQKQIGELSTADNTQKQELLIELEKLKNKDAERVALKEHKIDSLRNFVKGYAVVPFLNDTLFSIYNKIGSLSAKDRAEAINNRIKKLADDYFFKTDSLMIFPSENTSDIVFGETIIMSISENDALWQNKTKENLSMQYKTIIGNAVMDYKQETSWQNIAKQVGLALLVLLVTGSLIYFIIWFSGFLKRKMEGQKNIHIRGIKVRNYNLLTADKQIRFLGIVNTILKWAVIIIVVYLALPILFSIFPWTKSFADKLFSYFLNPLKNILNAFWNYLPNFFTILVIVVVFHYFIKVIHYFKTEVESGELTIPGFYPDWANSTYQIIKVLLFAFMFVVIFPYLPGSESPVFQGVSVFLGVLFTFGSSGSLNNIIAGLVLTYMRAFKIGDRVKIADVTGDIIEKSILITRIRTIKNEIISIPNSNVINSHTINYSSDAADNGLIMHTTVTIGYDVPWKNMHQALMDAALRTEHLLKEPKPFVLQTSLDDFYVSYQINAYTREPNKQALIYSQLHQNIQDCCNEAGIEILSPHYRAARDGNMTTIPADYLEKDYKAPSFNIKIEKEEK